MEVLQTSRSCRKSNDMALIENVIELVSFVEVIDFLGAKIRK
jgi:hypothetical protein